MLLQNGDDPDVDGISRRSMNQLSQTSRSKSYTESHSSDERHWLDSPVDTDDITVHVTPVVSIYMSVCLSPHTHLCMLIYIHTYIYCLGFESCLCSSVLMRLIVQFFC